LEYESPTEKEKYVIASYPQPSKTQNNYRDRFKHQMFLGKNRLTLKQEVKTAPKQGVKAQKKI
jgi:hypothetical protein